MLVIYELCVIIDKNFKTQSLAENNIDYLVCVSNNGVSVATIVGQLLGIDVLYLMNLGPNLTLHDKNLIKLIVPHKKYLFIYDFICLGTEYRITKSLLQYKDCVFLGGVGVALYTNPLRNESMKQNKDILISLIDVCDKEYEFNYEVYSNSKEIKGDTNGK